MAKERQGTGWKLRAETLRSKYRKGKIPTSYTLKRGEGATKAAEHLFGWMYDNTPSGRIQAQRHAFELMRYNNIRAGVRGGMTLRAPRVRYADRARNPYWAPGYGGAQAAQPATQRQQQTRAMQREGQSAALRTTGYPEDFGQRAAGNYAYQQQRAQQQAYYNQQIRARALASRMPGGGTQLKSMQKSGTIRKNTFLSGADAGVLWNRRQRETGGAELARRVAGAQVEEPSTTPAGQLKSAQNTINKGPYGYAPFFQGNVRFAGPMGSVATAGQQLSRGILPQVLTAKDVQYLTDRRMAGGAIDPNLIFLNYAQDEYGNWILLEGAGNEGAGGAGGYLGGGSGYYGGYGYGGGFGRGGGGGGYRADPFTGNLIGRSGRSYATMLGPVSWRI